jgi:uracil-DNA glycosylase
MAARRDAVLREMGLGPVWRLRGRERLDDAPRGVEEDIATTAAPDEGASTAPQPQAARSSEHPRQAAGSPAQPAAERIPRRTVIPPAAPPRPPAPQQAAPLAPVDPARSARIASLDRDALEADIRNCRACRLCEKRQQAVPGVGDQRASWMLVGEGPGAEEDQRGEPFVGAAGQLLDNMLAAIGLRRGEDVFIANAVKCRPPFNRTPEADEIAACLPYLERQIELIQP